MRLVLPTASAALAAVLVVGPACREPSDEPAPPIASDAVPTSSEVTYVSGTVDGSLYGTLQDLDPEDGAVLSAIFARLYFWDLDINDLEDGDRFEFVYTWEGEWPEIPVARYHSRQLGRTLHAYAYQPIGDPYRSWFDEDGVEIPKRLVDSPVRRYEQVTSLLKDRPTHRGMDFKVDEGEPVLSPRDGEVTRTNWNTRFNGQVIEIAYDDGVHARFLHLSEVRVAPGDRIEKGQVIGLTGNTGRSTAPHLHYELERDGEVVDPVDYHGTTRRRLNDEDLRRFQRQRRALDALLQAKRDPSA